MEDQIQRQHGRGGDEELSGSYPVMQGEEGHHDHDHHEKKSMLQNVKEKTKEKAMKIKKKLSKPKQDHGHDHDHDDNNRDEEEEDDDDDEHIVDPDVHGAPMYESAADRSGVEAGQQHGVNLEKPTSMAQDRYDTSITDPPTRPSSQKDHEQLGQGQGQFGNIEHTSDTKKGDPRVKIGNPMDMNVEVEDPNAPKERQEPSNYQSKVADPTETGGADAGITPILHSFDKMSVHDEPLPQSKSDDQQKMFTGSHDQFSPEPIPEKASVVSKDPGSPIKALASGEKQGEKQTGYTEKISSATSALTEKAVAAKNVVASKLGYGEKEGSTMPRTGGGEEQSGGVGATVADYGRRAVTTVTGTLAPVTEKVTNVGNSVLSKVQGGTTGQTGESKGTNKGVKQYLSEKLSPSEEDKALSEVISDTLYTKKPEAAEKPVGKVTVSEEVESRLGIGKDDPKREKEADDAQVEINANPAVLERVKGWFGIGQSQSSTTAKDGKEQLPRSPDSEGEKRLQESSN